MHYIFLLYLQGKELWKMKYRVHGIEIWNTKMIVYRKTFYLLSDVSQVVFQSNISRTILNYNVTSKLWKNGTFDEHKIILNSMKLKVKYFLIQI